MTLTYQMDNTNLETYRFPPQTSRIQARILAALAFGNRDDIFTSDDELCVLPIAFVYNNNFCCKAKLNAILSKLWSSGLYKSYCKTLHSNRF
ncbi:hypothetical protein CEXT_77421 [Caerostris extrusa]|uniref:LAGLIDADG homing endonuclease n=1 Tax=Caerostris extrusa TaxID=172846 RepID=A0AAV4UAK9_CAEEX|nr:hypothetical protein CEXT_77421 [Caerostris extrusa]